MSLSNNISIISSGQRNAGDVGTWMSAVVGRLHRFGAYLAERRARSLEMDELSRLSDRELRDIGLSRSDTMSIEKATFRRD
jgi:uncharacterized protein YjiS (DUF1127 family)